jgi:MFS family permease
MLRALGQGSMSINATLLTAQWFARLRGRAMAVVGLGFALSSAVLPPLSRWLIDLSGWRQAYVTLGVLVWVMVVPAALLVVRDRPEDIGLHPDGADMPPAGEAPAHSAGDAPAPRLLTSARFWRLALPLAVPAFVVTALVFHQTSIFAEHGLSADLAAGVFVPYAAASVGCSLLAGVAVDRFGPKRLLVGNLCLLSVGTLLALTLDSRAAAVLYAVVLGASGGAQSVAGGVTWAHYYGRQGLGRVQGMATMVSIAGAALGPLPLAALREVSGSYTLGLAVMAALPALGALVIALTLAERPAAVTRNELAGRATAPAVAEPGDGV